MAVSGPLSPSPIPISTPATAPRVRRRVVGQRNTTPTQIPPLVFTRSKGPADFFHDDSRNVAASRRSRKTRQRHSERLRSSQQFFEPDDDIAEEDPLEIDSPREQVPATIPNSTLLEHIATSRFFHHYVSPNRTFFRLDLDFTSFVIDNAAMRGTLAEVAIALGILTLPRKTDASCMAARLRYARALRFTNQALQDKTAAKSDEVLMAVILLSLFETTPDDEHSVASWTAHLDGARMLLRMRGLEMLQRGPTYRMFSMLRQQILVNCLMTMQPVPQDLVDLSTRLSETQDEDEKAASRVVVLFARLCNLFAVSRDPGNTDREDVLTQAKVLDDDLMNWAETLPQNYKYSTEPAEASANTYSGYYEIYSSLFVAEVWNLYRAARLGVNGLIVELNSAQGRQSRGSDPPEFSEETEPGVFSDLSPRFAVLESLRNDVCASTPFLLGRNGQHSNRSVNDIPLCKRTPVMHFLLLILKTAGITKDMSEWAMSQVNELQSEREVDDGAVWNNSSLRFERD